MSGEIIKEVSMDIQTCIWKTHQVTYRKARFMNSFASLPDSHSMVYIPSGPEILSQAFKLGQAREMFRRIELSLLLGSIDSGLSDDARYGELVRGEYNASPPQFEFAWVCPDGHDMEIRHKQFYRCRTDGYVRWLKDL